MPKKSFNLMADLSVVERLGARKPPAAGRARLAIPGTIQ